MKGILVRIFRIFSSKWFYYLITGVIILFFAWKFLPYLEYRGIISEDLSRNLFSEAFGIFFTLFFLITVFELREEFRWRKVEEKVMGRIGIQLRELFIYMTRLVEFTWSTNPYEILNELHKKETLTFSKEGKKLLVRQNFMNFLQTSKQSLNNLEKGYFRFLNADLALSLIEIQSRLERFIYEVTAYKIPSIEKHVSKEFKEKEICETIHSIINEIHKIRETEMDFWIAR